MFDVKDWMSCIESSPDAVPFTAVYSIGDIHSDSDALLHALALAGTKPGVDPEEVWEWSCGEHTAIVLTGDLFDNARPNYSLTEKRTIDDPQSSDECVSTARKNEIPREVSTCLKMLDKAAEAAQDHLSRVLFVCGNHDTYQLLVSRWYTNEHMKLWCERLLGMTMEHNSLAQMRICDDDTEEVKRQKAYEFSVTNAHALIRHCELWNPDCELKVVYQIENAVYVHGGLTLEMFQVFRIFKKHLFIETNRDMNFFEACNFVYNLYAGSHHSPLCSNVDVFNFFNDVVYQLVHDRSLNDVDDERDVQLFMMINGHNKSFGLKPVKTIVVGHTVHLEPIIRRVIDSEFAIMFGDTAMSIAFQHKPSHRDYSYEHVYVGRIDCVTGERLFLHPGDPTE